MKTQISTLLVFLTIITVHSTYALEIVGKTFVGKDQRGNTCAVKVESEIAHFGPKGENLLVPRFKVRVYKHRFYHKPFAFAGMVASLEKFEALALKEHGFVFDHNDDHRPGFNFLAQISFSSSGVLKEFSIDAFPDREELAVCSGFKVR
jgi:hypothetical protein